MTTYRVADKETGKDHEVEAISPPAAALEVAQREFPYCGIWRVSGMPTESGVFDAYTKDDNPEVRLSTDRFHVTQHRAPAGPKEK